MCFYLFRFLAIYTRSDTRRIKSNKFKTSAEVRITRAIHLDKRIILQPRRISSRRATHDGTHTSRHDEMSIEDNDPMPNEQATGTKLKSILKKPKCVPFGIFGRRKSTSSVRFDASVSASLEIPAKEDQPSTKSSPIASTSMANGSIRSTIPGFLPTTPIHFKASVPASVEMPAKENQPPTKSTPMANGSFRSTITGLLPCVVTPMPSGTVKKKIPSLLPITSTPFLNRTVHSNIPGLSPIAIPPMPSGVVRPTMSTFTDNKSMPRCADFILHKLSEYTKRM